MGYFKDTAKGISWVGSLRGVTRIITLVKLAILARILTPSQFGVFGIASLVLSLVETLTETGINVFLVQKKGEIDKIISSAWIISILRGTLISLIIILTSPFIASFFKSPDSYSLLTLISIVPFLRGFINPSIIKFQKDLKFHIEFYYRFSLFSLESIISISLAWFTGDASSFVWGMIASGILEVVLSFIIIKPIPTFIFDPKLIKEIIHNGKWVTGTGIFNYLFSNVDNIVVGKLLGTTSLGFYQAGYRIATLPTTEISDVISRVVFPVYVKISNDYQRLRKAFLKTTFTIFILSFLFSIILFFFTEQVVYLILGPSWLTIVPALKILSIFSVVRTVSGSTVTLFLAVNKQKYAMITTFICFFGLAIFIYPLVSKYELLGAAASALIGAIISSPFYLFYSLKIFKNK